KAKTLCCRPMTIIVLVVIMRKKKLKVYLENYTFLFLKKIIKKKMNISLLLLLIGILGFVLYRKNIILMFISIEIILLSITLLILVDSICSDDVIGQLFSVYIIVIAGAESAIGLAILVAFYRLRGTISIQYDGSNNEIN